ncbi:MAG: hypothetical protein HY721_28075 [Planctomycetes bacterium]|nr:hypothetical protein [Planctomycetota bacterium]
MASFRQALGEARAAGVPVGLYVEGYLLEERGKLGSGPGKAWQIAGAGGQGLYWPGATEMFICPHVKAWRETQAATYRLLAESFAPDGVYIDQLGFADWGKRCWSAAHGHPVPAAPLLGERELTRDVAGALAAAGRPETAVYTEEVPCDIANGFQDGRFTYAMNDALRSPGAVPLNLARFAFPAFKTFEILICDQPTGSWAEGVLWTFFNGEGLWLEGPAFEWFRPRTLEAVRRAHAVLRRHREAFMTLEPEPLVPTLAKEVLANRFPAPRETVYTLLSTLPCTWRGPVLAVPAEEGSRFLDAWNDRPLEPRRREGEGGQGGQGGSPSVWEVAVEIEPYGVGCVVVSRG